MSFFRQVYLLTIILYHNVIRVESTIVLLEAVHVCQIRSIQILSDIKKKVLHVCDTYPLTT